MRRSNSHLAVLRTVLPVAFLALAMSSAALAAGRVVTLDSQSSKISFLLGGNLHDTRGSLKVESGEIRFDPVAGTVSGSVTVDAASAETGNGSRDKKMHKAVLESARYPKIIFRLHGYRGQLQTQGEGEITLLGRMEIHGSQHEVEIPTVVRLDGNRASGTATFTVPYVAWGLEDPSVFILRVHKEVQVSVELEGALSPAGEIKEP